MGSIDKTFHRFNCLKCRTTEIVTVYQKGSTWGASWQPAPSAILFTIKWKSNQFGEPRPELIKCLSCKADVTSDSL
jgi:hypothetical protein